MSARAALLAAALCTSACTDDTYVIGALCSAVATCPGAGGTAGNSGSAGSAGAQAGAPGGSGGEAPLPPGTLAVELTGSGPERLPLALFDTEPSHFFIADDASAASWQARVGRDFALLEPAALTLAEPGPFADPGRVLSHAGAVTFSNDSAWADTSAGALALEVVFRAEPSALLLSQRDGQGMSLEVDATGRLSWRLAAASEVVVTSQTLVKNAWHHCLALLDSSQAVAQLLCNGKAGSALDLPAGFTITAPAVPATLGGSGPARVHWAELARWQAAQWAPRGAWTDLARLRFARLVGSYATGASEPLPFADVRASGAYLDMSPSDAPRLRRLHPVGEDWPRIVCRPAAGEDRLCGLLVEASSSQPLAPEQFELDQWDSAEVTLAASDAEGPSGDATLFSLTPGASASAHTLELEVPYGDGPAVLSFFARAGSRHLVRAEAVGIASATFDIAAGTLVDSGGTEAVTPESWGGGLSRLSFSFDVEPGPGTLRLTLLDDDGSEDFAGDGSVAAELGGVELRFRSYSTPLPTFGAIQRSDGLVYPTGNGNFPTGDSFSFSAEVWLPPTRLLADAALLNANFATHYEQQINLYVSPAQGTVQFWGKQNGATPWQFSNPTLMTDGALHRVHASVGPSGARLDIDGEVTTSRAGGYDLTLLDRVEVGATTNSSGPLSGIIRRVLIAPSE